MSKIKKSAENKNIKRITIAIRISDFLKIYYDLEEAMIN